MKKLIALLVVVLVATSVFAAFNVGVSAGFEQFNGKLYFEDEEDGDYAYLGKKNAFAAAVNASYDITEDVFVFDSFSFLFGNDLQFKVVRDDYSSEWLSFNENYEAEGGKISSFTFKNRVGVGYNLPVDLPVKLSVGASFVWGQGSMHCVQDVDDPDSNITDLVLGNLGAGLNLKAVYPIQDGLSAFIAADGDFGFYQYVTEDDETKTCNAFSFSFGAKAGVMYSF